MKTTLLGILVVVKYGLGAEISDVRVTDGVSFATDSQRTDATEKIGRELCRLLADREGYADGTGKLLQELLEFDEVTIHDEKNSALYRLKIQFIREAS